MNIMYNIYYSININIRSNINKNNRDTLLLKPNHKIWTADGRAVRLLPDNCVRIELKTRFCAARHVRIKISSLLFYTFMVLNLCQTDSKAQHQNPIRNIIIP